MDPSDSGGPAPDISTATPVIAARRVDKSFGPVQVLHGIDLALTAGEVHAIIGENGAGKSTLIKALAGFHPPTAGSIELDGRPVRFRDSKDAEAHGVVLIHQELNLAEMLTVEENIFLGHEIRWGPFLDKAEMRRRSRAILNELEVAIDPRARVQALSVSAKQMVEIGKAMLRNARILIMDEPTAVLTGAETAILFRLIRRLKAQGVTIVYISHKLNEVQEISDRVTVLRDGRLIDTHPTAALTQAQMAQLMVGRDVSDMFPPKRPIPDGAPTVLSVGGLTVPGWAQDASFDLRRGEVLGFFGLIGAGRTELVEGLLGLRHRQAGEVTRNGSRLTLRSLKDANAAGIAYLTEDRKGKGLLVGMDMRPNLTLLALDRFGSLFLDKGREQQALQQAVSEFDIRAKRMRSIVGTLSGGNQQKLLLAKTMLVEPDIVIIDEPTRGIDVGTKQQIYAFIDRLAASGKSIIVISSEMPEIIGLCHRVVVMRSGRITGILAGDEIAEDEIVLYATGLKDKTGERSVTAAA